MVGRQGRAGRTPIAVEPSLMASREYSTWNRRPSGEKVLAAGHCQKECISRNRKDDYGRCILDSTICQSC